MAYDYNSGPWTELLTTGMRQYRFVNHTGALVAYPAAGARVDGVLVSSGSTGSTSATQYGSIQSIGVAKVEAPASTLAAGDFCAASSVGYAVPTSAGDYTVGKVIQGSSGAANRVLSVLLLPWGTT